MASRGLALYLVIYAGDREVPAKPFIAVGILVSSFQYDNGFANTSINFACGSLDVPARLFLAS